MYLCICYPVWICQDISIFIYCSDIRESSWELTKRIIAERDSTNSLLRSCTTTEQNPDYSNLLFFLSRTLPSVVENRGQMASIKDALVRDWASKLLWEKSP